MALHNPTTSGRHPPLPTLPRAHTSQLTTTSVIMSFVLAASTVSPAAVRCRAGQTVRRSGATAAAPVSSAPRSSAPVKSLALGGAQPQRRRAVAMRAGEDDAPTPAPTPASAAASAADEEEVKGAQFTAIVTGKQTHTALCFHPNHKITILSTF